MSSAPFPLRSGLPCSQVDHLKIDFRDVILEGEYVPKPGGLEHIRNLNEPFNDEA
jgi:hypothetical protein